MIYNLGKRGKGGRKYLIGAKFEGAHVHSLIWPASRDPNKQTSKTPYQVLQLFTYLCTYILVQVPSGTRNLRTLRTQVQWDNEISNAGRASPLEIVGLMVNVFSD